MENEKLDKTINWYNNNAKDYVVNAGKISNTDWLDNFIKRFPANSYILDAGCAGGRDSQFLKDRGHIPVGVDLSSEFIEIAQQKHPDIKFILGSFLDLPFDSNSFDGIWCNASLLHLETNDQIDKALTEFHRVLNNQGLLYLSLKQKIGTEKLKHNDNRFFNYFELHEVKKIVEDNNFEILELLDEVEDPGGRLDVRWVIVHARKK